MFWLNLDEFRRSRRAPIKADRVVSLQLSKNLQLFRSSTAIIKLVKFAEKFVARRHHGDAEETGTENRPTGLENMGVKCRG